MSSSFAALSEAKARTVLCSDSADGDGSSTPSFLSFSRSPAKLVSIAATTALDLDRLRAGRLRLLLLRRLSLVSIGILKALATESSVIAAVPVAPAIVL